jgi:hypothetical protein
MLLGFDHFNISNGFGSASFSNQNADGRLSPEYQQMKDKMLSMSSGLLNFDPNQTSQNALGLLRGLAQPEENRQYYDLESRLFSQGTLGAGDATGSNPSMRAYFDSRNQADLSRQLQSIGLGESMMNNRITQSRGLLTSSEDLDQKIMDMIKLGIMGGQADSHRIKRLLIFKLNVVKTVVTSGLVWLIRRLKLLSRLAGNYG